MSYVQLDDNIGDHPKFLDISDAAFAMWARAIAYASKHLTDGFVPESALRRLTKHRAPKTVAMELVRARLFDVVEGSEGCPIGGPEGATEGRETADRGSTEVRPRVDRGANSGFRVHDYLAHNASASTVRARREAEKERKRAAREKQGRDASGRLTSGSRPAGHPPGHPPDVRPDSGGCPTGPLLSSPLLSSSSHTAPARAWSVGWCSEKLDAELSADPMLAGTSPEDRSQTVHAIATRLAALDPENRWPDPGAEVGEWLAHVRKELAAATTRGEHWSDGSILAAIEAKALRRIRFRPGDARKQRDNERADVARGKGPRQADERPAILLTPRIDP